MTLRQFLRILRARLRLIGAVVVVVLAAALVVSLMMSKKYTAEAALVVDTKSTDPMAGGLIPSQMLASYIATQVDIIDSDRVALRVVERNGLDRWPEFQDDWQEATGGEGDLKFWIATALRSHLEVKPSRESNVIRISFTGSQPEFAAMIANAFAQAYMETALELMVQPARQYAVWFNERTKGLREELEAAQKRLSEYQQEHRIIAPQGNLDIETARLAELSSQLVTAQGQGAESRSRQSEARSAEFLPEVTQNVLIANLKGELARREAEREQLLGRLGPNHPEVVRQGAVLNSLRQRIAEETRRIAASLGATSRISTARESEIAAAVAAQEARVLQLKEHRDQIAVLQRDVESAQKAYEQIAQRLASTSLESQTQQTNAAILTTAPVPIWPSSPRLLVKLALALVVGVVLGVGSAVLIELVDQRVRAEEDLAWLPGLPVLGSVPGGPPEGRHIALRSRLLGRKEEEIVP